MPDRRLRAGPGVGGATRRGRVWLIRVIRRMLLPGDLRLVPEALRRLPRGSVGRHLPRPRTGALGRQARAARPAPQGPGRADYRFGGQDGAPGGTGARRRWSVAVARRGPVTRGERSGLFAELFTFASSRERSGVVRSVGPGDGGLARFGGGGGEPLARDAVLGVLPLRLPFRAGGWLLRAALRDIGRRAQEPACRSCYPRPVIVVGEPGVRRRASRLRVRRDVRFRVRGDVRFRVRGDVRFRVRGLGGNQAGRHRPGRNHTIWPEPVRGARTLRFFGRPRRLMTILTRPVTFCAHRRPQFSQFRTRWHKPRPSLLIRTGHPGFDVTH